jgi:cytochrome c6
MHIGGKSVSRSIAMFLSILLGMLIAFPPVALAADATNGAKLFEVHCAGCHINGGNIVRRNKTLKLKALERNGYSSVDTIATIVANGKANMSAYKNRLSPTEIEDVSAYVLEQANHGWKS